MNIFYIYKRSFIKNANPLERIDLEPLSDVTGPIRIGLDETVQYTAINSIEKLIEHPLVDRNERENYYQEKLMKENKKEEG